MGRLNFLYRMDLPHRALSVYIYLSDRANKNGECWPAIPTIAKELKLSQSTVRRALRDLPFHPTVFIVSQRTASVHSADRIVVLDDGRAVGIGTHEELLRTCGVYREIYESQYKKEAQ